MKTLKTFFAGYEPSEIAGALFQASGALFAVVVAVITIIQSIF